MEDLLQQARRSALRFVASHESILPLNGIGRVREPVSRSRSGVQGKVADVLHGRSRHAESQNEIKAFRVLMATARADAWQEQPFCLEYHHDGSKHRYTPDILVVWGVHREVVEVKEDSDADRPENQARFAVFREHLAEHGYHFRVWKRSEICAEPRLSNASLVLRYRCVQVPAAEHEEIRRRFSSTSELPLGMFCEGPRATVQNVLRLVLDGTLHIDWWEPLSLDSQVSVLPIGRREWPSPPTAHAQPNSKGAYVAARIEKRALCQGRDNGISDPAAPE